MIAGTRIVLYDVRVVRTLLHFSCKRKVFHLISYADQFHMRYSGTLGL